MGGRTSIVAPEPNTSIIPHEGSVKCKETPPEMASMRRAGVTLAPSSSRRKYIEAVDTLCDNALYMETDEESLRLVYNSLQYCKQHQEVTSITGYIPGSQCEFNQRVIDKLLRGLAPLLQSPSGALTATVVSEILSATACLLMLDFSPVGTTRVVLDPNKRDDWTKQIETISIVISERKQIATNSLYFHLQIFEQCICLLEDTREEGMKAGSDILFGLIKSAGSMTVSPQLVDGILGGVKYGAKLMQRQIQMSIFQTGYMIRCLTSTIQADLTSSAATLSHQELLSLHDTIIAKISSMENEVCCSHRNGLIFNAFLWCLYV